MIIKKLTHIVKKKQQKKVSESFCYTSKNNKSYLNVKDLKQLIKNNF